jgi:HD superfamily phosphodiesterase
MNLTLDEHARRDPRIKAVYREARRFYSKKPLYHHNMEHVARDVYRALVIAADEEAVNYSVLIPSVLLHDIGFNDPEAQRLGHDLTGARMVERVLTTLDYDEPTVRSVSHCILAHKGKAALPKTLEAKILYDADVLEKAGLVYLILGGKIICEFDETIQDLLERESKDRATEVKRGFYTQKARELDGGRLKLVADLLQQIKFEINSLRPDYAICEHDLWARSP